MVDRALGRYFLEGGREPGTPYRPNPTLTLAPSRGVVELSVLGNFVHVWLAKQGHSGVVGINFLEKIQRPTPSAVLGAMLVGVDYVLMGTGIPARSPASSATSRPGAQAQSPSTSTAPLVSTPARSTPWPSWARTYPT